MALRLIHIGVARQIITCDRTVQLIELARCNQRNCRATDHISASKPRHLNHTKTYLTLPFLIT